MQDDFRGGVKDFVKDLYIVFSSCYLGHVLDTIVDTTLSTSIGGQ